VAWSAPEFAINVVAGNDASLSDPPQHLDARFRHGGEENAMQRRQFISRTLGSATFAVFAPAAANAR
jgi:hypothetical protein